MHSLTDSLRDWRRLLAETILAWALALLGIALIVLALPVVLRSTRTVSEPYRQQFSLSYTGRAIPGGLYASKEVTTGQPMYFGSLRSLIMTLHYRFSSQDITAVVGTLTSAVALEDQGINKFIVPPDKVAITKGAAGIELSIPLSQLAAEVSHLSGLTGLSSFPVVIAAVTAVTGTASGQRIAAAGQASYTFTASPAMLVPTGSNEATGVGSATSDVPALLTPSGIVTPAPPMVSSSSGTATRTGPVAGAVKILGLRLPGLAMAWLGLGVALIAVCCGVLLGRKLRSIWSRDPRLAALLRLGGRAVATHGPVPQVGTTVAVEGVDDLRRLSRLLEVPILRADGADGGTTFMVHDDRYVYCYRVAGVDAESLSNAPVKVEPMQRTLWSSAETLALSTVVANGSSRDGTSQS